VVETNNSDNTVTVLLNKGTDFSISAAAAIPDRPRPGWVAGEAQVVLTR
jgi:hypothetical protein